MRAPSKQVINALHQLRRCIDRDSNGRGIRELAKEPFVKASLLNAAQHLTAHGDTNTVAVLTGFPCVPNTDVPTETDGPPGALSLCTALRKVGKDVIMVTDDSNKAVMEACLATLPDHLQPSSLLSFPARHQFATDSSQQSLLKLYELYHQCDHFIAIERPGQASDGKYYTMKGRDISEHVAPLDILFHLTATLGAEAVPSPMDTDTSSQEIEHILHANGGQQSGDRDQSKDANADHIDNDTDNKDSNDTATRTRTSNVKKKLAIAIGDGGNEMGMGSLTNIGLVQQHIPMGETVGSVVPSDHLIVCDVSNWGGYALSAAMGMVHRENIEHDGSSKSDTSDNDNNNNDNNNNDNSCARSNGDNYAETRTTEADSEDDGIHGVSLLPTREATMSIMQAMREAGARDGVSGELENMSVDGLPLETHLQMIERLEQIALDHHATCQ